MKMHLLLLLKCIYFRRTNSAADSEDIARSFFFGFEPIFNIYSCPEIFANFQFDFRSSNSEQIHSFRFKKYLNNDVESNIFENVK